MGNRSVLSFKVKGLEVNAFVFDGEPGSGEKGEVSLKAEIPWDGGATACVRTYCRAGELRGLAAALIAAADDIEAREGA